MTKTMAQTVEIDGEAYTLVADGSYYDPRGGEWSRFEIKDMRRQERWAERELAKIARRSLLDPDNAALYLETLDIRNSNDEGIRIMEALYGEGCR